MRIIDNLDQLSANIYVTEAECEEGIVLKINKEALEGDNILVVRIALRNENEPAPVRDEAPTIPGHPNCHYGECLECHNVACAIYQGYEEMP